MCITCMGVKHAQQSLLDPEACPHCKGMQQRVLERRLRVSAISKEDPGPSSAPSSSNAARQIDSWADAMDIASPLPPLFDDQLLDVDKAGLEDDDEAFATLLGDEDDDDEDAILPLAQASRPASALSSSPEPGDFSLIEVCKRAATRLKIDWPAPQNGAGVVRDIFDGKRLPSRAPPARQLLPAVPACVVETKRFWDKPFSHRVPVKGFSTVDIHGMDELGLSTPPTVEPSVAHHLHPSRRISLSAGNVTLPEKTDRFTASVFQKIYKSSSLGVRTLNATTLLSAYQAELLEEMGSQLDSGIPNPALWEEICFITDLNLRTSRGAIQSCGRAMGLAVVGERALWLNLSTLNDKEKVDLLDAAIDPKVLFGPAIAEMRTKCDLQKKEHEAFDVCLPRKPPPRPASSSRAPAPAPQKPRGFQQPSRPKPQQAEQAKTQPKASGPRSWSRNAFSVAAAKHRPSHPQGTKKRRDT